MILPIFYIPPFYNKLRLVDLLFARTQTILVLAKRFSFINKNVSLKQILIKWYDVFPLSCLRMEESGQRAPFMLVYHPGSNL